MEMSEVSKVALSMIAMGYRLGLPRDLVRHLFTAPSPHADSIMVAQMVRAKAKFSLVELRDEINKIMDLMEPTKDEKFESAAAAATYMIDRGRRAGLDDSDLLSELGPKAASAGDRHDKGFDLWLIQSKANYTCADMRAEIGRRLRQ